MAYNSILVLSNVSFGKNYMKIKGFSIDSLCRRSDLLIYPIRHSYNYENYDDANYYWGKDIYQKN